MQGDPSNASHSKPCFFGRMFGPGKKSLPSRSSPPSVETGLCCGCFGNSCKVLVGKLEQFSYRLMQKCKKLTCEVSAARGCRGRDVSGQKCWEVSLVPTFFWGASILFHIHCSLPHPSPKKTQKCKTITPASAWLLPGHLCHAWELLLWAEHVCINSHSSGPTAPARQSQPFCICPCLVSGELLLN